MLRVAKLTRLVKLSVSLPTRVVLATGAILGRGGRIGSLTRRLILMFAPSLSSRIFWTEREVGNQRYVNAYWDTRNNPLRTAIAETIAKQKSDK